jgi:hypothetical protein
MSAILPVLLLVLVIILFCLMAWNRPDPKHLFIVELLIRIQGDEVDGRLKSDQC